MEVEQLNSAVFLKRPVHVPQLPIGLLLGLDKRQAGALHQHLRHVLGHVVRRRYVSVHDQGGIVRGSFILHLDLLQPWDQLGLPLLLRFKQARSLLADLLVASSGGVTDVPGNLSHCATNLRFFSLTLCSKYRVIFLTGPPLNLLSVGQ